MSIKYKNSDILSVSNVAGMFLLKVNDNQLFQTLGYTTEGVGANLYRYDAASTATIDGGFVLPGIGGVLSFSDVTFNGTAGAGRFVAVDQVIVDVTKFGAVHDGVTIDDAPIHRALKALTSGGACYFPKGTYLVNPVYYGPTIFADNVTIYGDGNATIVKGYRTTDDPSNQFYNIFETAGRDNITLRDMRFEGYITALYCDGGSNIDVTNISGNWHIANASNYYADKPLCFYGCTNVRVSNCHFENFYFAVYLGGLDTNDRCNNVTVTGCTFEHTRTSSFTTLFPVGVYVYWADNVSITGNSFRNIYPSIENGSTGTGMGYGVYEGDGACRSVVVTGNSFEFRGNGGKRAMGVYLSTAEAGTISGNTFTYVRPKWKFFTVDTGTDVINCKDHGFVNGDAVYLQSGDTLPSGLSATMYVVGATTDTFQVETSVGAGAANITTAGSGLHVVSTIPNTAVRIQTATGQKYNVVGNTFDLGGNDYAVYFIGSALNSTVNVSGNTIVGGQLRLDGNIFSGTFTATAATDVISKSNLFNNGDRIIFDSTGTLPAGLSATQVYYVTDRTTTTFKVSATKGGPVVDITDTGSGTHTVYPQDPIVTFVGSNNAFSDLILPAFQATSGSDLNPFKELIFTGNNIKNVGRGAVLLNTGCLRSQVTNNIIIDCNTLNKAVYGSVIMMYGKSHGCYISGNTAKNTIGGGGHAKYFMEHIYNQTDRVFKDLIYNNSIDRMDTATYLRYTTGSPTSMIGDVNYGDQFFRCPPAASVPHYWTCSRFATVTLTANAVATDTSITVSSTAGLGVGDVVLFIENAIGIDWQYSDTTKWHATTVASVTDGTHFVVNDAIPSGEAYNTGRAEVRTSRFTASSNL